MKNNLYFFLLFSIVFVGCKTEEPQNPPTVFTKAASDVTSKNATLNGEVTDEGFSATSDRGFVFSEKNTNPSVSDSKAQSGYGKGIYSIVLDKLPVNTKYYYKAYATNTKGTAYGEVQSFTTADYKLPTAVTDVPKNITYTTVELGGSVTDEGGGTVSESGFVVGTNASPTITDLKFPVTKGKTAIALIVSKLNVNTKYYVRSYAINSKGIGYGNEQSFTTLELPVKPRVNTAIVEVKSKTGRIWMDRNLGATRAAISSKDTLAIGDLYQWGRLSDGHELRTSAIEESFYTNSTLSITDVPGHAIFIRNENKYWRQDWRLTQNDNLWQGVNGINNPCPNGYRLPTITEYYKEMETWNTINQNYEISAFASALKLPIGGYRLNDGRVNGPNGFSNNGTGFYWSSTVIGVYSESFSFSNYSSSYNQYGAARAMGMSVRCIKD